MIVAAARRPVAVRLRALWLALVAGIAAAMMILGVAYGIGGFGATVTSKPYAIIAHTLPDGKAMYVHGWIMVTLAFLLLWTLAPCTVGVVQPRPSVRPILRYTGGYLAFTAWMFAMAPLVSGGAWNYAWVWPMVGGCFAWTLSAIPPPTSAEYAHGEPR